MKQKVVGATEFKAKCLALLDELEEQGGEITVTKRGRPIATVRPAKKRRFKSTAGILEGKIEILGDIVNFETTDLWEALRKD